MGSKKRAILNNLLRRLKLESRLNSDKSRFRKIVSLNLLNLAGRRINGQNKQMQSGTNRSIKNQFKCR